MIITQKIGALEYLTAEDIHTPHAFTTRFGGVSTGSLSSLNLGLSRGDKFENVLENYRRLGEAMGFDPAKCVLSRQVHSDIVYQATRRDWGAGLTEAPLDSCDALITNVPGTALTVFTADCTPILLWDPVTGAVGAAHAGWRGTVSAIAAKTAAAMCTSFGCEAGNLRSAIGPNIGLCHFQTDADVPDALHDAFGSAMDAYIVKEGEKYRADLKAVNAYVLRQAGVSHIEISTDCTMCQPQRFWSHRVTKGDRGSQGGIIVCTEAGR